jgi:predicted acylesterase/phospholipase RssA
MRVLVLSAGGSFGAYQIGAWAALEEAGWQPDLIVGASIGAVNGLAISRGARAEDLMYLWRDAPVVIEKPFPSGVDSTCQRVSLARRTGFFRSWVEHVFAAWAGGPPRHDLWVTLTAWPSCALHVAKGPHWSPEHFVATCAVPAVMPPVRVEGKLYVDGGTFCPLPLRPAIEAGATEIVAVDLLAVPPSRMIRRARIAAAAVRNLVHREPVEATPEELARVRLIRVQSSRLLGTLDDCFTWDPQRIEALSQAGYHDTLSALEAQRILRKRPAESVLPSASPLMAPSWPPARTGNTAGSRLSP